MQKYSLDYKNINYGYYHFTKKKNIISISKYGLLPKRSSRTKYLEDTNKVFFFDGLNNILPLLNLWLNDCEIFPLLPGLFSLGSRIKGKNIISKTFLLLYFYWTKFFFIHKIFAYKYFDWILDNCVLLKLNIKNGIDFDKNDIDQIKNKDFNRDILIKVGYSPKYSNLNSTIMDKWNMHTLDNHLIASNKIKLCYIDNSNKLKDILIYCINNSSDDIKDKYPVLFKYLKNRKFKFNNYYNKLVKYGIKNEQIVYIDKIVNHAIRKNTYSFNFVPYHDIHHVKRCLYYSAMIVNRMNYKLTKNYINILFQACLYHDCGRSLFTMNHGKNGSKKVTKYLKNSSNISKIKILIEEHNKKNNNIDFKKYLYKNDDKEIIQLLSNILKDADALDRNRIKTFPWLKCNIKYLRTKEAKDLYQLSDNFLNFYNLNCK